MDVLKRRIKETRSQADRTSMIAELKEKAAQYCKLQGDYRTSMNVCKHKATAPATVSMQIISGHSNNDTLEMLHQRVQNNGYDRQFNKSVVDARRYMSNQPQNPRLQRQRSNSMERVSDSHPGYYSGYYSGHSSRSSHSDRSPQPDRNKHRRRRRQSNERTDRNMQHDVRRDMRHDMYRMTNSMSRTSSAQSMQSARSNRNNRSDRPDRPDRPNRPKSTKLRFVNTGM